MVISDRGILVWLIWLNWVILWISLVISGRVRIRFMDGFYPPSQPRLGRHFCLNLLGPRHCLP